MEMTKQPAAARRVRLPKPGRIVINVVLIVCSLIWIYPIIWTIISSFKPQADFFKEQLSLFPATWTLDNYVRVWSKANFAVYFFNSVVVTVFSVLLVLPALLMLLDGVIGKTTLGMKKQLQSI